MPIHDQGYRRYRGARDVFGRAWLVILAQGAGIMVRRRMFLLVLLFAWIPFVIRAVQIYASANFPNASFLAVTAPTFREFLEQQNFFVFIVTVYVGAGMIANDRRANALQIYLSKPLTRAEYVAGKLGALVLFLLFVTWIPAMLLLVVQVMFAGSVTFVRSNLFLVPAITLYSLLVVLLASFTMLALSSLSRSSRFVGVMYAGVMLFTSSIYGVVFAVTGQSSASWVSVSACLSQVGDAIFRMPLRYDTPLILSLGVILVLIGMSIVILERRVRGVEIVT